MELAKKILWQGKFLRVVGREFINKKGGHGLWECVERTNSREIVAVFAVTEDREVILIKQYRFPLQSFVVELPAGLSDRAGESLKEAARRELWEETGYRADELVEIQRGPFNSGMSNCLMVTYYAPKVEFAGFGGVESDDNEEIEVIKVPVGRLVDFCLCRHNGFWVDTKILAKLKILEAKKLI